MIGFAINRKTGEERIINAYDVPGDNPLKPTAQILAKMIIEHGLLKNIQMGGK